MRWKSEKGPALTRYDPVPPYWLVYQGPRGMTTYDREHFHCSECDCILTG